MLDKKIDSMDWDLFFKIDMDVENGFDKNECIEKWGKELIEQYEQFADK